MPKITVENTDSVSAIFAFSAGKTAVLNFASYKHPGGMFIEGSSAQEESLCHASFLYNVLKAFEKRYYVRNRQDSNCHLYRNRALYSPDVIFEKDGKAMPCDVLTCAAPNYKAAFRYFNVARDENREALESRIRFVKEVAEENGVQTLIAGAFGCGVFGQDSNDTAQIFAREFRSSTIRKVVFAIPGGRNLAAFRSAFPKTKP